MGDVVPVLISLDRAHFKIGKIQENIFSARNKERIIPVWPCHCPMPASSCNIILFYYLYTLQVKENVTSLLGNINDTTKAADVAAEGIDDAKRPIPPPRTRFPTPTPTPTPTLVRKTTADTAPRRRRPESADVIVDGSGVGAGAGGRDDIGSRRPRLKAAATAVAEGHGGLPDKHRSLHMPLAPIEGKKLSKKGAADLLGDQVTLPLAPLRKIMSDESHDYSEIFTPNGDDCSDGGEDQPDAASDYGAKEGDTGDTRTGSGDSGLTGLSSTGTAAEAAAVGAPAPPLHRYPSWEDRIYRVAREGLSQVGGGDDIVGEGGNARNSMCGGYGNDIVVPVYASVKGVRTIIMHDNLRRTRTRVPSSPVSFLTHSERDKSAPCRSPANHRTRTTATSRTTAATPAEVRLTRPQPRPPPPPPPPGTWAFTM